MRITLFGWKFWSSQTRVTNFLSGRWPCLATLEASNSFPEGSLFVEGELTLKMFSRSLEQTKDAMSKGYLLWCRSPFSIPPEEGNTSIVLLFGKKVTFGRRLQLPFFLSYVLCTFCYKKKKRELFIVPCSVFFYRNLNSKTIISKKENKTFTSGIKNCYIYISEKR